MAFGVKPLRWAIVIVDPESGTIGHEQRGQRRALVVSYESFHASGMATVCPISARERRYPGEIAIAAGHAGPGIIDREDHGVTPLPLHRHADRSATVLAGILQQVGEDALEAELVQPHHGGEPIIDVDRDIAEPVPLRDAWDELADVDLLAVELGRARVDAGQLE